MIGAGTFINPLIRIATTVAILAAVYLFLVKPVLDTTEETVSRAFDATEPALRQAQELAQMDGVERLHTPAGATPAEAERVLRCVRRATGDVGRIQACATR